MLHTGKELNNLEWSDNFSILSVLFSSTRGPNLIEVSMPSSILQPSYKIIKLLFALQSVCQGFFFNPIRLTSKRANFSICWLNTQRQMLRKNSSFAWSMSQCSLQKSHHWFMHLKFPQIRLYPSNKRLFVHARDTLLPVHSNISISTLKSDVIVIAALLHEDLKARGQKNHLLHMMQEKTGKYYQ